MHQQKRYINVLAIPKAVARSATVPADRLRNWLTDSNKNENEFNLDQTQLSQRISSSEAYEKFMDGSGTLAEKLLSDTYRNDKHKIPYFKGSKDSASMSSFNDSDSSLNSRQEFIRSVTETRAIDFEVGNQESRNLVNDIVIHVRDNDEQLMTTLVDNLKDLNFDFNTTANILTYTYLGYGNLPLPDIINALGSAMFSISPERPLVSHINNLDLPEIHNEASARMVEDEDRANEAIGKLNDEQKAYFKLSAKINKAITWALTNPGKAASLAVSIYAAGGGIIYYFDPNTFNSLFTQMGGKKVASLMKSFLKDNLDNVANEKSISQTITGREFVKPSSSTEKTPPFSIYRELGDSYSKNSDDVNKKLIKYDLFYLKLVRKILETLYSYPGGKGK